MSGGRVVLRFERSERVEDETCVLGEVRDTLHDSVAFEFPARLLDVMVDDLPFCVLSREVPGFEEQVQRLPCVTGVLCAVRRTERNDVLREGVLVKRDLFTLGKHLLELRRIVRRERDFLFTERGTDFRREGIAKREVVADTDEADFGVFEIAVTSARGIW